MHGERAHEREETAEGALETVLVKVKWQKMKYDVAVRLGAPTEEFKWQVRLSVATWT